MSSGAGHSGGGFRGGRYRSRGRPIPYSRGGGDSANWKRSSNGGGFGVKTESDQNRPKADVASPSTEGGTVEKQSLLTTPDQERGSVQSSPSVMQPGLDTSSGAGELADLREVKRKEMKSSVKARLFVGNLPKDTSQDIVRELFRQFGEVKEMFLQREKNFGFVKMVYRSDAECAVASLDGKNFKGRDLKVRFAASNSSVKVSNLHPVVSNELLLEAFSQFGEVEKAVVVTDERGKSLGHGIVDFSRKGYAQNAIRKCIDEHFILTKSPMPVLVEEYLRDNDEDGQPERYVPKSASYRMYVQSADHA